MRLTSCNPGCASSVRTAMRQGASRPRGLPWFPAPRNHPHQQFRHPCRNFLYKYRHNLYICIPVTKRIPLSQKRIPFAFLFFIISFLLLLPRFWPRCCGRARSSCGRWGLYSQLQCTGFSLRWILCWRVQALGVQTQ